MRVVKPQELHHAFRAIEGNREVLLVVGSGLYRGDGRHAYLWVGTPTGTGSTYTFGGPKSLRALAKAILKAIP